MGITQQIGASSLIKPGVIDNTAARPASPFEGQMVYEKDTDMIAVWNGTAWRYIAATTPTNGTVLQMASATKTDTATLDQSSYTDITGLSVSITPKSTSSKILVRMYVSVGTASSERAFFSLFVVQQRLVLVILLVTEPEQRLAQWMVLLIINNNLFLPSI